MGLSYHAGEDTGLAPLHRPLRPLVPKVEIADLSPTQKVARFQNCADV
jgi:hypothetical protein